MAILFDRKLTDKDVGPQVPDEVLPLTSHERQRSRLAVMLPSGRAAAIVLPRGVYLAPGDVLVSESGVSILVQPADEPLMRVSASSPHELMRIVYHLANRHVRAMLAPDCVWIQPDAVLAALIARLGGTVQSVCSPFLPEGGAYAGAHHHGECDANDATMGSVGEALSIAAHARRVT